MVFSSANLNTLKFTIDFSFAFIADHYIFAVAEFMEPACTLQTMNESFPIFLVLAALLAYIYDVFAQISLFVKMIQVVYLVAIAVLAQPTLLESLFGFTQTALVIVILTECTLQHFGVAGPSVTDFADADAMSGVESGILVFGDGLVTTGELMYFN